MPPNTLPQDPDANATFEQTKTDARAVVPEPEFSVIWNSGSELCWESVIAEAEALAQSIPDSGTTLPTTMEHFEHGLTQRELEVLRLLINGDSNRSIADTLSLSERTVENHVLHILSKLDVQSRTAAATYAVRNGFV